jgi:hypothetical protein
MKDKLKLRRLKQRQYKETQTGDLVIIAPTEYGLQRDKSLVARIVRTGDGWRVVRPTPDSNFGEAVSPVGLNGFTDVKNWAMENLRGGAGFVKA